MANWEDIASAATSIPGCVVSQQAPKRAVVCAGQTLAWERPYTQADIKRESLAGATIYPGDILAVHLADSKEADELAKNHPGKFFITQHFRHYPAVLCRLENLTLPELVQLLERAWLTKVHDKGLG